jgi:hypothetical protein
MARTPYRECVECGAAKPEEEFPKDGNTRRRKCRACFNAARRQGSPRTTITRNPLPKKAPYGETYVITYAQNATPVNKAFLESLKRFCEFNDAVLLVLPGRYKNPTSTWSAKAMQDDWWAKEVVPYLFAGRRRIGDHLTIYGDISIQPTAVRPLTGFEVFSGQASAIFGHPKIQFKTVPTAKRKYPRILSTTGAVTVRNYTDSKAGKKGEAHHVFGAAVVEKGTNLFHIRQINAVSDGTFIDLDKEYTPEGVYEAEPARAIVFGDVHEGLSDPEVIAATFEGEDSIMETLQPREAIVHDLLHMGNFNRHTLKDFDTRYDCRMADRADFHSEVQPEVMRAIAFLDQRIPEWCSPVVVQSNHDEMLDWWLRNSDWQNDPKNALFYHEAWAEVLRRRRRDGFWTPAFRVLYDVFSDQKRAEFLDRDTPRKVGDIFLNFHGDIGLNGSKGSSLAYSKLGVKAIIGHYHSPEIIEGCYVVGVTGRLDQYYNNIPSSWMNTHCVVYANGKRSLISVIDGEWRAL